MGILRGSAARNDTQEGLSVALWRAQSTADLTAAALSALRPRLLGVPAPHVNGRACASEPPANAIPIARL
jgi:hypothetical protein